MQASRMERLGVVVLFGCLSVVAVITLAVAQSTTNSATQVEAKTVNLVFIATGKAEYEFDTGVIRGTLRAEGKSLGLSSVVHVPSGVTLSRGYGIFSHY